MSIERFSKPSIAVIKNKASFFQENDKHLSYVREVNKKYTEQPKRTHCKNCGNLISGFDFESHGVPYVACSICTHLNGLHEDTNEFVEFLYLSDGGSNYKENYLNAYDSRVDDIYTPKVEFMKDVLAKEFKLEMFSVLDVGCGGGHFVKSCENLGLSAYGVDPNAALIELGNQKLRNNRIGNCSINEFESIISKCEHDVVSLIGVMEHLQEPRKALLAFKESKAKYLYLQVPLFSFSVLLEHINQDVFPRQFNAGHTHLYTDESLDYICKEFGLNRVGEWWFGTDMVDLFRHLVVKSAPQNQGVMDGYIKTNFSDMIDELQNVFDNKKRCSGVNMILSKS